MAAMQREEGELETRLERVMGELDRLVNWERRDRTADMGRSLAPVRDLLKRMGQPQESLRVVHVAGTKGKGSVASLVAAGLSAAGVKCGCYSSPHVERVTERVRVDGEEVREEQLARALEVALEARARSIEEETPASASTWFDLFTSAAFQVFADLGCDWVALECGLGGRLDSTNVADGDVCVLTNVDLEHTSVLGDTLQAIAEEKAAILPEGGVLVVGRGEEETALTAVAKATAAAQEGSVRFLEERAGSTFKEHNVRVARAALEEVEARGGPAASALLDQAVISSASLPARAERFAIGGRAVVLEGAHVASSVKGLLDELAREEPFGSPCAVVLALGREKDARAVLKALRGHADRVHCTTSHGGPLATGEELAQLGRELGIDARDAGSAREALQAALSGDSSWVLVLGSFYLAGELRPLLLELDQDKCSPSSQTSCSQTPS
jgi:dihydrofolate synthase/folylpolyglutamate synthase